MLAQCMAVRDVRSRAGRSELRRPGGPKVVPSSALGRSAFSAPHDFQHGDDYRDDAGGIEPQQIQRRALALMISRSIASLYA